MDDLYQKPEEKTPEELEREKNPVSSGAVEWHDPLDVIRDDETEGKCGLTSLVLGIAGILFICAPPVAGILGAIGVGFGAAALAKKESPKNLAVAGFVCSLIPTGVALGVWGIKQLFHVLESIKGVFM